MVFPNHRKYHGSSVQNLLGYDGYDIHYQYSKEEYHSNDLGKTLKSALSCICRILLIEAVIIGALDRTCHTLLLLALHKGDHYEKNTAEYEKYSADYL